MIWICQLCEKKEHIHRCTDGTHFVFHHCQCFGGAVSAEAGKNVHRYVASLQQFFQNRPNNSPVIEVTVFPLKETS